MTEPNVLAQKIHICIRIQKKQYQLSIYEDSTIIQLKMKIQFNPKFDAPQSQQLLIHKCHGDVTLWHDHRPLNKYGIEDGCIIILKVLTERKIQRLREQYVFTKSIDKISERLQNEGLLSDYLPNSSDAQFLFKKAVLEEVRWQQMDDWIRGKLLFYYNCNSNFQMCCMLVSGYVRIWGFVGNNDIWRIILSFYYVRVKSYHYVDNTKSKWQKWLVYEKPAQNAQVSNNIVIYFKPKVKNKNGVYSHSNGIYQSRSDYIDGLVVSSRIDSAKALKKGELSWTIHNGEMSGPLTPAPNGKYYPVHHYPTPDKPLHHYSTPKQSHRYPTPQ